MFEEGVGGGHVTEVELLADVDPSSLFEGGLGLAETVLVEFLPVVIHAVQFLLVVIEDGLDIALLEDFFHEFFV